MSRRDPWTLFTSTACDERATALLGVAVGVLLGICFVTGVTSHLIQHPPSRRLVRRAPEVWRWPLQLGLVVSGVLALARVPVLYGVGRDTQPGNASVLPGDYPRAVAGVLALVWTGVLVLAAGGRRRAWGWTMRGRARSGRSAMKRAA